MYVGISVENIITPSVSTPSLEYAEYVVILATLGHPKLSLSSQAEVEEVKEEPIIKEKKEVKRSKSWGRRSTRAKKSISYR